MVKIRLRRVGAKKQPHYRVVVADSKSPRDGKFIETIGYYNPRTEPPTVEIDAERALYWLSVGAQPSAAVKRMLDKMGLMSKVASVRKGEEAIEEILAQIVPAEEEEAEEVEPPEAQEEAPEVEAEEESPAEEEAPAEETPEEEPEPAEEEDLAEEVEADEDEEADDLDDEEEADDLDDEEADDVDED
jgi:small subunit ribosomal protein S16